MTFTVFAYYVSHISLAVVLFFFVNWIGKNAVDFGYSSTTLFDEMGESPALNFFLRTLSPAVFVIAISAFAVAIDHPEWRLGIQWVAIYYYLFRGSVIFLVNRQHLIRWPEFFLHAVAGISFTMLAYNFLIIPNRSLLPDLDTIGNELWLAILAFLYAVANKVPVQGGPGANRQNKYVRVQFASARSRFEKLIEEKTSDDILKLIIYAVMVYEDYARPAAVRTLERYMFWKKNRTTGIMQVSASLPISDAESVARGAELLINSWVEFQNEEHPCLRLRKTIGSYNGDDDYINNVQRVMNIIAKRVDRSFLPAYESASKW